MLIWLLSANFLLSIIYALIKKVRHERGAVMAIFFIFLPGLGFLIYFLPSLLQTFLENKGVDKEAILTHIFEIEGQPEHPDIAEALNIVPVEDAMAIGNNAEKRGLLLKQLKKNLKENYKILLSAEQDEDSESAHYVAAAKMEIYRLHQTQWLESRRDYEEDPDNPTKYHMACTILVDMLASGVFSIREQNVYRKYLCDLVQKQIDTNEKEVAQKEYEEYLDALIELGRYEEAQCLWKERADRMRSENAYRNMLKMFYLMKEPQKFEDILNDLCQNKQVRLSSRGLEQLRYWTHRLNKQQL